METSKTEARAKAVDGPQPVEPAQTDGPGGFKIWLRTRRLVAFYALSVVSLCALIALTFEELVRDVVPNLIEFLAGLGMPVNVVGIAVFAVERPAVLLVFGFMIAPSAAALAIACLADGRAGVGTLLRRLHPCPDPALGSSARRSYLLLLVGYVAVAGLYLTIVRTQGSPETFARIVDSIGGIGLGTVGGLLILPWLDEGGLFQELGWRGYALPLLLQRVGRPLLASIALGVMWWAWYLPRELSGLAFGVPVSTIALAVLPFLLYLIGLSILITYFWFQTGGSILPAIAIHGGANALGRVLGSPVNEWAGTDVRLWLVGILTLGLLALVGPSLGQRPSEPDAPGHSPVDVARDPDREARVRLEPVGTPYEMLRKL